MKIKPVTIPDIPDKQPAPPIVWTIAGSDSGGGAGIQADLKTFHSLQVHGCSVITALTAQNSQQINDITVTPVQSVNQQIAALHADLPAKAIKLGMLAAPDIMRAVNDFLYQFHGPVICDPVLRSSSGTLLSNASLVDDYRSLIIPQTTIITPNLIEAELLSGITITTTEDIQHAAAVIKELGCSGVIIKGGHASDKQWAQDYCLLNNDSFWLSTPRWHNNNSHGTGCTFSAAVAATLAFGYIEQDAIVIAKSYVSQSIREAVQLGQGPGPVAHQGWPQYSDDLPLLTRSANEIYHRSPFPACTLPTDQQPTSNEKPHSDQPDERPQLGLYPIVDNIPSLEQLLTQTTISTVQIRLKQLAQSELEEQIATACQLSQQFNCRLFVNDHWQLAMKYKAYGVHLGQEDLQSADLAAIKHHGLRLGISTHCYHEIAHAHAIAPSYIAYGPIYETLLKEMPYCPRGLASLRHWVKLLAQYSTTAIGGISEARATEVLDTGVNSFAVVSAISTADDPIAAARRLLHLFNHNS